MKFNLFVWLLLVEVLIRSETCKGSLRYNEKRRLATEPSIAPTSQPSAVPSGVPSSSPTLTPSGLPSSDPSSNPSTTPSRSPTSNPSSFPSSPPTPCNEVDSDIFIFDLIYEDGEVVDYVTKTCFWLRTLPSMKAKQKFCQKRIVAYEGVGNAQNVCCLTCTF